MAIPIVFDLETLAMPRELWFDLSGREPATSEAEQADEEKAYRQSWFDGSYCRIVCIGALIDPHGANPVAAAWYGEKGI